MGCSSSNIDSEMEGYETLCLNDAQRRKKFYYSYNYFRKFKSYESTGDLTVQELALQGLLSDYQPILEELEELRKILKNKMVILGYKTGSLLKNGIPRFLLSYHAINDTYDPKIDASDSLKSILYLLSYYSSGNLEKYNITFKDNKLEVKDPPEDVKTMIEEFNEYMKSLAEITDERMENLNLKIIKFFKDHKKTALEVGGQFDEIEKEIKLDFMRNGQSYIYRIYGYKVYDKLPEVYKWFVAEDGIYGSKGGYEQGLMTSFLPIPTEKLKVLWQNFSALKQKLKEIEEEINSKKLINEINALGKEFNAEKLPQLIKEYEAKEKEQKAKNVPDGLIDKEKPWYVKYQKFPIRFIVNFQYNIKDLSQDLSTVIGKQCLFYFRSFTAFINTRDIYKDLTGEEFPMEEYNETNHEFLKSSIKKYLYLNQ